ncbi:MAG TPA: hypothetical protein VNS11_07610 [Sphingomicrobium sp.]|nr:hypothetical protein [Sphingomicrobium sp.]
MIAALLMLAQIVPVPAEPKPVATTIAAIRANPKKFDGQIVRVRGYVNRCEPLSCWIEERTRDAGGSGGAHLSIATDRKFDATIKPLLPTYVEFDARVDAACLTPSTGNSIKVCADRVPELTIVSLRGVVSPEPPPIEN